MNEFNQKFAHDSFKKMRGHIYKCMQILCSNGVDCSELDRITAELTRTWKETLKNPKMIGKHQRTIYYKQRQNERRNAKKMSLVSKLKSWISRKKEEKHTKRFEQAHNNWIKRCNETISEQDHIDIVWEKMDKAWKETMYDK